jgi:adenosylhomocysteine nucleosidase
MTPGSPSGFERVGIVTGLEAEARIARRLGRVVAVGGGTADGARAAARILADQGATALVSFGLAGGLDPVLVPGTLIVPDAVMAAGALLPTDPALSRALGGPTTACLLGADAIAATAAEKRQLWEESGCAALDLESGGVAEIARAQTLPFAVLRAVCDPAGMSLPAAALLALSLDGRMAPYSVFIAALRDPAQIPALLRLGAAAARARGALTRRVGAIRAPLRIGL